MTTQLQQEIGTDFVGYRIEALIGRGAMGVVYRAYDLRLKRTVALKLVAPELALDPRFRTRFVRETELAMSLEHPNVVPIYDAGDVDGRLYLAMRLVNGADLRTLLRTDGPLEPKRSFAICDQIGAALDAAHARGLVHCDVKPSNVLIDQNEHVYVADLGLGRRLEEQRPGEDDSMGTPAYLAPEHIEGLPIDGRADVYSLGCLLFECLTGELPFERDSRLALAWAHLEEDPPRASERNAKLPGGIDGVLAKALAKAPSDRYPSCAEFLDDAERALGLGRPPTRRRLASLLAAVVIVAAVVVALAALMLRDDGSASVAPTPRPDTLLRIDPVTDEVTDVIPVQFLPYAVVYGGGSVWVMNNGRGTISEVDASTAKVRRSVSLRSIALRMTLPYGPLLAGDAHGAWFIGMDRSGHGFVANVRAGARGKREFPLDARPKAVATGEGAVWVLVSAKDRDEVVRIDPATGRTTGRSHFARRTRLESLTAGLGAVWAVDSAPGVLFRIDPRTLEVTGRVAIGRRNVARPLVRDGVIWVGMEGAGAKNVAIDPKSLEAVYAFECCPPHEGNDAEGFGSFWMISWPTGVLVRWNATTKQKMRSIRLVQPPVWDGLCLTDVATGGGAVWVTVAQSSGGSCPT